MPAHNEEVFVRKAVLLSLVLLLTIAAGCTDGAGPSPSPSPSEATSTSAPGTDATEPPATEPSATESPTTPTPSGPATCEVFDLPSEAPIPPIDEDDHVVGPDDASITFIEYADFHCPA